MTRQCSDATCDRPHLARGLCKKHYNNANRAATRSNKITVPCDNCGALCEKNKNAPHERRYCSYACRSAVRARTAAAGKQIVLHTAPAPRSAVPRSHQSRRDDGVRDGGRTVFVTGPCARCGELATSRVPQAGTPSTSLTCSMRCTKALTKARRRAMMRDAYVEPVSSRKVYERDNWICQLCHEPLARDEVVPHPLAPTVDHIIPLAPYEGRPGGAHSMANVQSAHYLCNSTKSHRV